MSSASLPRIVNGHLELARPVADAPHVPLKNREGMFRLDFDEEVEYFSAFAAPYG